MKALGLKEVQVSPRIFSFKVVDDDEEGKGVDANVDDDKNAQKDLKKSKK